MKFTILFLVTVSASLAMSALVTSRPDSLCNGANERWQSSGGGCFRNADGTQQCLPSKAPSCECASGFQRIESTQKCEPIRLGRSVGEEKATTENCTGPHEQLVAVGGGCFVNEKGVQVCLPAKPPTCQCVSGFERNPATKQCETLKQLRPATTQN